MPDRIYNFAAGPATLPVPVLEEAQANMVNMSQSGMSLLEMSHRSDTVETMIKTAEDNIRSLAHIPDNYKILFLQGGASLQFSMVPMNLLRPNGSGDHIITGHFAKLAFEDARKTGDIRVAGTTEEDKFSRIPGIDECHLNPSADYLHITTNNTIFGTEWHSEPDSGLIPLVGDSSSNIFSKPIDITKFGLIYAGAQKNLGAAGVTLVIIRDDLLERSNNELPSMFNYNSHVKGKSAYNTPPVFGIYILGLVVKWIKAQGGLTEMGAINVEKAQILYDVIDSSDFYTGHAKKYDRSNMNITFNLPNEELESEFCGSAALHSMVEIKGHRSVGGIRASIYNAFPTDGVHALAQFMRDFEKTKG
ncbi:MAG: 3-phosphoserine/phosphohydroxythreonine transaminase [Chloroflexota bacterium]|nr:3-phosphoserine/phosphohydroxythreonine transaminase [Chloroflexota bacterium]